MIQSLLKALLVIMLIASITACIISKKFPSPTSKLADGIMQCQYLEFETLYANDIKDREITRNIIIPEGEYIANGDMTIPKGVTVTVEGVVKIKINGKLIIHGNIDTIRAT